jgi:hypothetical protein
VKSRKPVRGAIADVVDRPQPPGATLKGSHVQLKHPTKPGRVTIPIHAGETLQPFIVSSILRQADLTVEDLRKLL